MTINTSQVYWIKTYKNHIHQNLSAIIVEVIQLLPAFQIKSSIIPEAVFQQEGHYCMVTITVYSSNIGFKEPSCCYSEDR